MSELRTYAMRLSLVKAHRVLAIGLALFILSHLTIHLSALWSPETHIIWLSAFQGTYRNWLIEPLLYLAIFSQSIIGARLVWRRYKQAQKGFWGWAQITSGLYLGMFMIVHGLAAVMTRYIAGLETNFYWAAGTLNIDPLQFFFAHYYWLGLMSVFVHLGSALYFGWPERGTKYAVFLIGIGTLISTIIVATFAGAFYDITLPQNVIDSFESYIPG